MQRAGRILHKFDAVPVRVPDDEAEIPVAPRTHCIRYWDSAARKKVGDLPVCSCLSEIRALENCRAASISFAFSPMCARPTIFGRFTGTAVPPDGSCSTV
jgi:hypothetical protein